VKSQKYYSQDSSPTQHVRSLYNMYVFYQWACTMFYRKGWGRERREGREKGLKKQKRSSGSRNVSKTSKNPLPCVELKNKIA